MGTDVAPQLPVPRSSPSARTCTVALRTGSAIPTLSIVASW